MAQYQVPQFLDIEDKIVGPLTLKQFLFISGGIGGGYLVFKIIPWAIIGFVPAVLVALFGAALAFYKFNNKPFSFLLESAFYYAMRTRLYVWKRIHKEERSEDAAFRIPPSVRRGLSVPTSSSKLSSLTWQIDTQGEEVSTQHATPKDDF